MSKALDIAENLSLLSTKYTSSSTTLDSVVLGSSTTDHASRALTGTFSGTIGSTATFPAGHIIQTQHCSYSTETSTDSTTFVATALTKQITMTSASNKVIIMTNMAGCLKTASDYFGAFTIYRGSTNLAAGGSGTVTNYDWMGNIQNLPASQLSENISMCYVDTPGTGTHTYTVYYGSTSGGSVYYCVWQQTSQMILMELAV